MDKLVLELCKFVAPNKAKIEQLLGQPDYACVLGTLLMNRMGGVAYYVLRECELLSAVNREFRTSLKSIYDDNVRRAEEFKKNLSDLQKILIEADFPYALLKGAKLVDVYPIGLRTSNDIDVLVNQDDVGKLTKLLKDSGFRQGYLRGEVFQPATRQEIISSKLGRGETVPFVKGALEVDINFSLSGRSDNGEVVRKMLKNARDGWLTDIDFTIHLCCHFYKEATGKWWIERGRDSELYKLCDLYLLDRAAREPWLATPAGILERVTELNLGAEYTYAIDKMKEIFYNET